MGEFIDNAYKSLHIKCGVNGLPAEVINNDIIEQSYLDSLIYVLIDIKASEERSNRHINENLTQAERKKIDDEKRRRRSQIDSETRFLLNQEFKKLKSKTTSTKIALVKYMIENRNWEKNIQQDVYNSINRAYENLNTPERRNSYNRYLEEKFKEKSAKEAKRDPRVDFLANYLIDVSFKDRKDTDVTTYTQIFPQDYMPCAITIGKDAVIQLTEGYVCGITAKKKTFENPRSNAVLYKEKIVKGTLYIDNKSVKGEDNQIKFYIGTRWIEQFSKLNSIKQEELKRAVLTAIRRGIQENRKYMGDVKLGKDGFLCVCDNHLEKRIDELEDKQAQDEMNKIKLIGDHESESQNQNNEGENR